MIGQGRTAPQIDYRHLFGLVVAERGDNRFDQFVRVERTNCM
jgi:hypothetical protein